MGGTRHLGAYEILSPLGAGGMGEVFLARDTRLDRQFALKVLPADADNERRRRFLTEARAASALAHPHVATIYDIGEAESVGYIAMELVEGHTLAHLIRQHAIDPDRIIEIAVQVADALQAAHDRGIVHRDIKPANVMITQRGQAKVLDFGIAKVISPGASADLTRAPETRPGLVMGTVTYMSPEQAIGAPIDHRSDMFSLGVTLYQMAAGRLPFSGTTDAQIVDAIRHSDPIAIGGVRANFPAELERIIAKCLEKDCERRYQSARELVIDLQALQRRASPPARPSTAHPHNLPAEVTSFVGREADLAELVRLLTSSSRLLSLVGAGGAGKTRLALRVAGLMLPECPDGVWLADLAPLSTGDLVPQTIATAVGVREGQNRNVREALLEMLRQRRPMIVLDNCEHLIDASADIAEALLRAAPGVRLIATSREPLGVTGETVWRVRSLVVPDAGAALTADGLAGFEATRLFIERARAIDDTFTVTASNATTIARICQRLDGIPLAIELAAARVAVLSVEQIDLRLRDRFRLLTGGSRTAVPRQRTLEATVDWSYQLLSEPERTLLARLSVFPAGWSIEAAEQVCASDGLEAGDVLDLLSHLVGKSLVIVESEIAGDRRYRFLETVRQYARDRLAQAGSIDRLRQRHFDYLFAQFSSAMSRLRGPEELPLLRRLRLEQDSVRAALEWALDTPELHVQAVQLATALFWYWTKLGQFREGQQWLERAMSTPAPIDAALRARALIGLGHMYYFQGMLPEAAALIQEALAAARRSRDPWPLSFALFMAALGATENGDLEGAAALATESRRQADIAGDPMLHGGPLMVLGSVALGHGQLEEAQQLFDESIAVHRRAGESWGAGILLAISAALRVVRGHHTEARTQALEALALCEELDDPRGTAWSLEVFAGLAAASGRDTDAARIWGASDGLLDMVGGSLLPTISGLRDQYFARVRAALDDRTFETAHAEGRALSSGEAAALARRSVA